jgi:hypothetical protein
VAIKLANVSWVYSNRSTACINGLKDVARLEVNVGNYWNLRFLGDDVQNISIILGWTRNANNVATGCGEFGNLLKGSVDVGSWSCGHGLNGDGSITTNWNLADHDLTGFTSRGKNWRWALWKTKIYRWHNAPDIYKAIY